MAGCPCGSGTTYSKCCEPYIEGSLRAPTAEALMRSRYTGYVKGAVDYVMDTHHPDAREEVSRDATDKWARESQWMGLEILDVQNGVESDSKGSVEFIVKYRDSHRALVDHHECSIFEKHEGIWYFREGKIINNPKQRESPKVGRNDPCTCGSGKKYKKCCGS